MTPPPPIPTLFPYTTLFRSDHQRPRHGQGFAHTVVAAHPHDRIGGRHELEVIGSRHHTHRRRGPRLQDRSLLDRKSTRLNSSHRTISYAVFCLKKKK